MATTRLSDLVIVPELFGSTMIQRTLSLNSFVSSGVARENEELNAFLRGGGWTISPRFIGPLDESDANISSDDPAVTSTPAKITGYKNTAVRQSLNKSWSSMDLTASLNDMDPVDAITSQVADYWNAVLNRRLLSSVKGAISGQTDMFVDVTKESGASALFNADAFLDTKATMGDRMNELSAIAVHSHVYTTMQKLNLIDFIPDSEGRVHIPTYMGVRVIVDDATTVVPAVTSGDSSTQHPAYYYSYLFGAGAVALGAGNAKVPFEIDRNPAAGNGGGEEQVYSRVEWVIHPQGYQFALNSTPTVTQLETASNWTRAFERKRVPIAALVTL